MKAPMYTAEDRLFNSMPSAEVFVDSLRRVIGRTLDKCYKLGKQLDGVIHHRRRIEPYAIEDLARVLDDLAERANDYARRLRTKPRPPRKKAQKRDQRLLT